MDSIGQRLRVTSFGESHSEAIGCVLEGLPAGIAIDLTLVQHAVDKRKTHQQSFASTRKEADVVQVVSGIFEGKTIGSPIAILIYNRDAKPADYDHLREIYRPGHADFTYDKKYGHRDFRGGGRSSFRITAPMVAAGEMIRQWLCNEILVEVKSYVTQIGQVSASLPIKDFDAAYMQTSIRCPDTTAAENMLQTIEQAAALGDTLGGCIRTEIIGLPIGIGEPIFDKLSARLASAMMSINTVKGFTIGDGFELSAYTGSKANDRFEMVDGNIRTQTNHSGGMLGGISNGMPVIFTTAFKPISSIQQQQKTINTNHEEINFKINGRHDVCAVPRAIPVINAYTFFVIGDLWLMSKK